MTKCDWMNGLLGLDVIGLLGSKDAVCKVLLGNCVLTTEIAMQIKTRKIKV